MKKNYLALILFFGCFSFVFGQSIFSNPITGFRPNNDNPYTTGQTVDANITVTGIGRGTGINGNNANNRYNARDWNTTTIDLTAYFEFTLTPNVGNEIDFISFEYTSQRSGTGPTNIAIRSSLDSFSSNIGSPTITGATIDLSGSNYQNITSSITFRVYAWNATTGPGTFSINDFAFNGTTDVACISTTTWNGASWNNGLPDNSTEAIIDGAYDTDVDGSISACTLTVNASSTLTIANNTFVEIQKDIVTDGTINVATNGSVVQINDSATVTGSGTITIQKQTSMLNSALEYTYWSSPVVGETIEDSFGLVPASRRFVFNAANFVDVLDEIDNTGTFVPGQDDIDDDGNAWQAASGTMTPGTGYATTAVPLGMFPTQQVFTFEGYFNNGIITSPLVDNSAGVYNDWNFIGNPYPSAIDASTFFTVNNGIVNTVYLWSQATPANANASGNEGQNFSGADYAVISASGMNTAGGSGEIPNNFIPSGQGFFVEALSGTNVTFNNSMRVTGDNDQFFRNGSHQTTTDRDAIWINLTSDNGIFNQIAVAHLDGATDSDDGSFYDVRRNVSSQTYAKLYSLINDGNGNEFVIQCKNPSNLNLDEVIHLGFNSSIDVPTIYTISLAQFEGSFLNANDIYLKDNLLSTIHNLKDSDYSFTSDPGEFNNRFEIVFNSEALSIDDTITSSNDLTITELPDGNVRIKIDSNLTITNVEILDILGRSVYKLSGNSSIEVYNLSRLSNAAYIAKVTLSNGHVVSKKAIKQQ